MNDQETAILRHVGRTLRPKKPDVPEPLQYLVSKQPVDRVLNCAELVAEAVRAEDRNASGLAVDGPALPSYPDVEIQETRSVGEGSDHLTFDWNRMGGNLVVERFAERDRVVGRGVAPRFGFFTAIEPKTHGVHEMEAGRLHNRLLFGFLFSAEENRGGEDALKGGSDPAILSSILREVKVIEQLSRTHEANSPALLFEG